MAALDPASAAEQVEATLREKLGPLQAVDWVVVCGSGMGRDLVGDGPGALGLEIDAEVPLAELGLPVPGVAGHGQSLVWGRLGESRICLQTGRIHPYEGHDIRICVAALSAVLNIGAGGMLLTCAVGGIDDTLRPGELVSLSDQMNLFGPTPLVGPRFIDCSSIYHPALRAQLGEAGSQSGEPLREVVYAHARGPQYETPAEVQALRTLGGQVVGMSTTYEAILAASYEVASCGMGLVTNVAAAEGLSHAEVQELALAARGRLAGVTRTLLKQRPRLEVA
jgi:purine-nucleoside phosphorylase